MSPALAAAPLDRGIDAFPQEPEDTAGGATAKGGAGTFPGTGTAAGRHRGASPVPTGRLTPATADG